MNLDFGFRHFHGTQVGQTKFKDFVPLNLGSLTTVLSIFFFFLFAYFPGFSLMFFLVSEPNAYLRF